MNPQLRAFRVDGHKLARSYVGRSVTINGKTYVGPRSELDLDPGDQQQVGMRKRRAFSITITLDQFDLNTQQRPKIPRDGADVVDDQGTEFKVDRKKVTELTVQFFCISKNS